MLGYSLRICLGLAALALAVPAGAQEPTADPSAIEVPSVEFTPTAAIERDYDEYHYYHRAGTDFATALADFEECDAYARGISLHLRGGPAGPLTGLAVDAIFGPAQRRGIARRNFRTCMRFKEYRRYGLPKSIWEQIHEPKDAGVTAEARRKRLLQVQARLASGPEPRTGAIAP